MVRKKLGATFALYSDPKLETIRAWGVADEENEIARPATFVVRTGWSHLVLTNR